MWLIALSKAVQLILCECFKTYLDRTYYLFAEITAIGQLRKFLRTVIGGLVQDCSNSSANALELLQSCTKPSSWYSARFQFITLGSEQVATILQMTVQTHLILWKFVNIASKSSIIANIHWNKHWISALEQIVFFYYSCDNMELSGNI